MSTGLYPADVIVERFQASVSAATLSQPFIAPADFDVIGLALYTGTAPGSTHAVSVNVLDTPTSQTGGPGSTVSAYNLWTTANVPTVSGTATSNLVANQATTLIDNTPYAVNYPLPGTPPVTGYETAQSTSQQTFTPVTTPPSYYKYQVTGLLAPDNTYTDYNGVAATPAAVVHAGDILQFVVSGSSLGSVANLEMVLFLAKH